MTESASHSRPIQLHSLLIGVVVVSLFVAGLLDPWFVGKIAGLDTRKLPQVLAILTSIPLLAINFIKNRGFLMEKWTVLALAAFILFANHTASFPAEGNRATYFYTSSLLVYLICDSIDLSCRQVEFIIWGLFVGCSIAIINMLFFANPSVDARLAVEDINGNYTSYCCVHAGSLLAVMFGIRGGGKLIPSRQTLLLIFMLVALTYCTILSASRGAFISMALILAIVFWELRIKRRWIKLVLLVVGLAVFGLILVNSESLAARFMGEGQSSYDSNRLFLWTLAVGYWIQAPFLGIGPGQFAPNAVGIPVHNVFLAVLTELGVVGFVLYFGILGHFLAKIRRVMPLSLLAIVVVPWLVIAFTGAWESSFSAFLMFGLVRALGRLRPMAGRT